MGIDIDITKLKLPNGRTLTEQMQTEAERFLKILQEEIDKWYASYSPSMYDRTFDMRNSIYAEDLVEIDSSGTQLTINIKYSNEVYHSSLWSDEEVNALLLMNSGYQVNSGWHKDIPYFGYRDGGHFLESTVKRFNQNNYFGIDVIINYY